MKLDTLDKKPKLYNILIMTFIAAAVISAIAFFAEGTLRGISIGIVSVMYFILMFVMLVSALVKQMKYNLYSYNTILYMGFGLFVLSIIVTHIMLLIYMLRYPEVYTEHQIIYFLFSSARNYVLLSFPFIFIFSVALCISNISLIRHEGRRLVNILGIILSFFIVGGVIFLYRIDYYAMGSQTEVMIHDLFTNLFAAIYLYFECMLIGSIIADVIAAKYKPEPDKDFIIILGCGIFARRVKMRVLGMGAKTKWYFWPNAGVREFIGLLTKHRVKQACVLIGLVIVYSVMTILNYTL